MKKHRKLKIVLGICISLIVIATCYFLISGWLGSRPKLRYGLNTEMSVPATYPDADFAVLSDIHLYEPSLGSRGAAFEEVMKSDRKLLLDSIDLLDYAINDILQSDVQFVLISGDLTKDGELVCHNIAAKKLKKLADGGKKVFVIPGNHDINNNHAVSYSGGETLSVDNISAADFLRIYADFGYAEALERDADSLSYVAEPVEGLWLLALDSCRYRENQPGGKSIVSGKISQATADWIAKVLKEATRQGKTVMAMNHHGIVEHWAGQHKLHGDYLIEDYLHFGEFLTSYNVRLAFSGHYHALDITRGDFGDKYLYDLATGSLITAPCPVRYCSLKDNRFSVQSISIIANLHPGTDYAQSAAAFVKNNVAREAFTTLKKYKVSDKDAEYIADAVGDAFVVHYNGDENPAERLAIDKSRLSLWGRFILFMQKYVLDGLWNDLYPADSSTAFSLE